MENNSLAVAEKFEIALNTNQVNIMGEEFGDGTKIYFDVIKIPSGATLAFSVPGEDDDSPDIAKELKGIVVDHHYLNACWRNKYTGAKEVPNCSSIDGSRGIDTQTGEVNNCSRCPFNQYGSKEDGYGKACKNMHRIYFLREGCGIPDIINLPPTSIKPFEMYVFKKLAKKGLYLNQAVTKITLKKAVNKEGIEYAEAVFKTDGRLSDKDCEFIKKYSEQIKNKRLLAAEGLDNDCFQDSNENTCKNSETEEQSQQQAELEFEESE